MSTPPNRHASFAPAHPLIRQNLMRVTGCLPAVWEKLEGKRLLLTGGTGFFGKWLLALLALLRDEGLNVEVTVVSRDPESFLAANPFYRQVGWVRWVRADVRQVALTQRFDLLLHAAADTSAAAHQDPLSIYDSILWGTRRVLDEVARQGIERVLLVGSGAQYGVLEEQAGPVGEDARQACASELVRNAYGEAKRAAETLGALYAERYGFEVVHARCFAFSGPGLPLDGHFAIGNFVRDALQRDAIVLASRGEAVRSYLHGADLAVWMLGLLVMGETGQAYNVGSDHSLSIAELARRVGTWLAPGKPLRIMGGSDDSRRSYYVPDITRARLLGLDVWTSLEASVDSMALWCREEEM